jgi:hypothetical protein
MAKADKITSMELNFLKSLRKALLPRVECSWFLPGCSAFGAELYSLFFSTRLFSGLFIVFISCGEAWAVEKKQIIPPVPTRNYFEQTAFSSSYIGLMINQNHPWSYGNRTWSKGGPSFGVEYRFFYKDEWTLAVSAEFKQLLGVDGTDRPILVGSQESMKLIRLYHPWYLGIGGRLSSISPVRKVTIPYERDDTRAIETGAAICVSSLLIASPRVAIMVTASRWRSLVAPKRQGIELLMSTLIRVR